MTNNLMPVAKSVMIAAALASALWVSAGSLTPPPGPITPTMKDLDDVEPRKAIRNDFDTITPIVITESGSYYLAEDIYAIHSQHGIEIDASQVTLDLNGFTIYGNLEVGSNAGIWVETSRHNITVKNGTIRDFNWYGIFAALADGCMIENVRVINNGNHGLVVRGRSIVNDCVAQDNRGDGIRVANHSTVTNCVAHNNGDDPSESGIRIDGGSSTVVNCSASNNSGWGIFGAGTTGVVGCTAANNDVVGIEASNTGHVVDCTAYGSPDNIIATSIHNSYGP